MDLECRAGEQGGGLILSHRIPVISSPSRALAPRPSGLYGGRPLPARPPEKSAAARQARAPRRAQPWYIPWPLPSLVRAGYRPVAQARCESSVGGDPPQRGHAPSFARSHCRPRSVLQRAVEGLLPPRRISASRYEGGMRIGWPRPAVGEPRVLRLRVIRLEGGAVLGLVEWGRNRYEGLQLPP